MHRPTQRLSRILACAAVPVILVATGCSSGDSGSEGGKGDGAKSSASPGSGDAAAAPKKAAYGKLPEPCDTISEKTLKDMVPEAKDESGKAGKSDDTSVRGTCSWSSLDTKGVDGSQFRWLNVSLMRFESDATLGSGDERAQKYFGKQVADAKAVEDATGVKTEPLKGTGDEANVVRYELKKKEGTFKQQSVVARAKNVVVTVDFNGAGLAGDKSPSASDLVKEAEKATKEAVEAVVAANGSGAAKGSGSDSDSGKGADSGSGSDSGSDSGKKS